MHDLRPTRRLCLRLIAVLPAALVPARFAVTDTPRPSRPDTAWILRDDDT